MGLIINGGGSGVGGAALTLVTQTGNVTATSNTFNEYGTVASQFTLSLPPTPAGGDVVGVKAPFNAPAFPLTVAPNGNNIDNSGSSLILNAPSQCAYFTFSATNKWRIGGVSDPYALGRPVSSTVTSFPASGTTDTTLLTVPALPSGAGRFVLVQVVVRLSTAMTGSGSIALTIGSSAGATDIVTSQTLNIANASVVGVIAGELLSTLGSGMLTSQGYQQVFAAGGIMSLRLTATGTVSTGAVTTELYGLFLP